LAGFQLITVGRFWVIPEEMALQSAFLEYDEVIQTLPADATNHPLDVSPLSRRTWR